MARPSPRVAAALAILATVLGGGLIWLFCGTSPPPVRQRVADRLPAGPWLAPGDRLVRRLAPGATDSSYVHLEAGDFLVATVEQPGIDLTLALFAPDGRELLTADRPTGATGPEPLEAVAPRSGRYRLAVQALSPQATGRYTLRLDIRRPATAEDHRRAAAAAAFSRGEAFRARGGDADLDRAGEAYRQAAEIWRGLGAPREEAMACRRLGQMASLRGAVPAAVAAFERALARLREPDDTREAARVHLELATAHHRLSDLAAARVESAAALRLAEAAGDRPLLALAWNALGVLHAASAEPREALQAYERALAIWQALADRPRQAAVLYNLGEIQGTLGRLPEARRDLEAALALQQDAADRRAAAATLTAIAWVWELAGELPRALELYGRTARLYRRLGDRQGEAGALGRQGSTLAKLGRLDEALATCRQALALFAATGDLTSQAELRAALGWIHRRRGELAPAGEQSREALALARAAGNRAAQANALLELARTEGSAGRLAAAGRHAERALAIVESLRHEVAGPASRIAWSAARHDYYEVLIDLLMRLDERRPERGFDHRAFAVSEQAHARSLFESLESPGAAPRTATPPPLAEIRRRLLGPRTVLLEYFLGEERSYLWLVDRHSLTHRVLPGRAALAARAVRLHDLLARSHLRGVRRQAMLAAEALSDTLVGPVAGRLGRSRLLVVPDGALATLPFGVLSVARAGGRFPLVAEHEIVYLPSAATAVRLRRRREERPPPPGLLAVVGDPVLERGDPRLPRLRPESLRVAPARFSALPAAPREVAAILAFAPPTKRLAALGFAASRETVAGGLLAQYRIVHFTTHGLVDPEHPELSGLALSRFDRRGQPQEGFLAAHEIAGLDLPADLVVLAACRTAVGREARGEGLLSLARSFFAAGAGSALVSLWDVDDDATAALMGPFYRGLLRQRLAPGEALRQAQLALRSDPRRQAPAFWAGFVLAGDGHAFLSEQKRPERVLGDLERARPARLSGGTP